RHYVKCLLTVRSHAELVTPFFQRGRQHLDIGRRVLNDKYATAGSQRGRAHTRSPFFFAASWIAVSASAKAKLPTCCSNTANDSPGNKDRKTSWLASRQSPAAGSKLPR